MKYIGGIKNITKLFDDMGFRMRIEEPRELYYHGLGDSFSERIQVIGTWWLTSKEVNGKPNTAPLDVVDGESHLLLVL